MMRNRPDKPLAIRNGLKVYTKLKAKKAMRIISPKQKKINKTWREVTEAKIAELQGICQWCGLYGERAGFNGLDGHHIIKRRFGINTPENCFVLHRICHDEVEAQNIDVRIFPTKSAWEAEVGR